ncbi:hypothetical protein [Rubritalea marina]|uniref:hypothetical protein n=1 Tax=Rubritalea marina TaxID=361055 RepID=UPI0003819E1B|nr:hypothetical protein [Rubritalea marina]
MNTYAKLKPLGKLAAVTATTLAVTSLTNCGGGGAATDNTIVRPRTLEQLVITYDNIVTYEFIRSSASGKAYNDGDIETGSVLYTRIAAEQTHQTASNIDLDVSYPTSINGATYTYQAINDTSGQIQITFTGAEYSGLGLVDTSGNTPNGRSFTRSHTVNFGNGSTTLQNSSSNFTSDFAPYGFFSGGIFVASTNLDYDPSDASAVSRTIIANMETRTDSGNIPTAGYDLDPDFVNRVSKVSPSSLNGYTFNFEDGSDPTDNFSLDFTKSAGLPGSFDEIGTAVFKDDTSTITVGSANYTYTRIGGSDSAQIVISGGTEQDGTIVVEFQSADTVDQNISGTYTTANGNSGTFTAPSQI